MVKLSTGLLAVAILSLACGRSSGPGPAKPPTPPSREILAKLRAADAADGQADKLVARCAVCGLAMAGTPDHASKFAGYELHFCSAECKQTFDHDPARVIARLP
jgi:YHS domain-containing protein